MQILIKKDISKIEEHEKKHSCDKGEYIEMNDDLIIEANGIEMQVSSDEQGDTLNLSIKQTKENNVSKVNNVNFDGLEDYDIEFIGDVFKELLCKIENKSYGVAFGEIFQTKNFEVCIRRRA